MREMAVPTFIIEHDTRGVLMEQEPEFDSATSVSVFLEWRSRFSVTRLRSEGMRFTSLGQARMAFSRLHPKIRRGAAIRRFGTWTKVDERSESAAARWNEQHGTPRRKETP